MILRCGVSASPYPATQIRWKKGETLLPLESGHSVSHVTNGTLIIHDVEFGDRGEYACVVNTSGYEAVLSRTAMLQIKGLLLLLPRLRLDINL